MDLYLGKCLTPCNCSEPEPRAGGGGSGGWRQGRAPWCPLLSELGHSRDQPQSALLGLSAQALPGSCYWNGGGLGLPANLLRGCVCTGQVYREVGIAGYDPKL